jgi:tetratricopeptide (TPR) repeat protein/tRNA A-37 threonylcarbamoyl transferase component Bud32
MSDENLLNAGETVGSYRIVERIGRGGMGEVYKAEETALERTVALKVMSASLAQDKVYVDRFRTEARSAASLVHGNVVHVFGIGEIRGLPYIAMEYIDGESIQQKLVREKKLQLRQAVEWMIQAARGLEAAAKRGIVHRDIKPHNLLIDNEGTLKIADFGLAKKVDREVALTQAGIALGTPLYMSPEQGRGDAVDWRSDVYSLGATFYHAMAGRAPFEADSALAVLTKHATSTLTPLNTVRKEVPQPLSAAISRMMAKTAGDRFVSHGALVAELERILPSLPHAALPTPAAVGGIDADDALFGRMALKTGLINEQQYKGAVALQEKFKATGKPARRLEEILVAAKILTTDQATILKDQGLHHRVASEEDEPESRGNLEVTEVTKADKAAAAVAAKGPVCPLCRLAVRPDQVQMNCPECGMTQHRECMASFGGCGNERCTKSPKSMAMNARSGNSDEGPRGAATAGGGGLGRFIFPLVGIAAIGLVGFLIWRATSKSAQDLYDEAKNMDAGGKGRMSIFSIDEANKDISAGAGISGEVRRRLETQVSLYRRALEKDPTLLVARMELAGCLVQLSRKPEALKEYETVLSSDPGNKDALLGAGSIQYQDGAFGKALDSLQKAAEAGAGEAWMTIAIIYQDKKNEGGKAVEALKKYLATKGDDGNAWSRLALAEFEAGDDLGAVAASEKAIQKGTSQPGAYLVRAKIAFKNGKFEEAANSAMEAAEKVPQGNIVLSFDARKLAGRAFAKAGKPQPAREQLVTAKSVKGDDVEVLEALGDLAKAAGDWNDAANNYRESFEHGSGKFEQLFQAGWLYYQARNSLPAAKAFEALYRKQPDFKDIRLWLARAYLMAGQLDSASPAVAKALEEKPEDPDRQALRVWELGLKVNIDEAIRYATECLTRAPGNGELNYRLAYVWDRAKNYEKQKECLAAAAESGLPDAMYDFADYCERFGDRVGAMKYLKLYLEKMPIGYQANEARNRIITMGGGDPTGTGTNPDITPGWVPPPSAGWEAEVKYINDVLAQVPKATEEPVDRVYFNLMACVVASNSLGERYTDITDAHTLTSYAELYLRQNIRSYLRDPENPSELATFRTARVKARFSEIAAATDRIVHGFASAAKKMNAAASSEIDSWDARYSPINGKDDFDRLALALDLCVRMVAAARGGAGAEAMEKYEARLTIAENPVQRAVASTYALCELMGKIKPEAEKIMQGIEAADEAAESGLSQLAMGLSKTAQILTVIKGK